MSAWCENFGEAGEEVIVTDTPVCSVFAAHLGGDEFGPSNFCRNTSGNLNGAHMSGLIKKALAESNAWTRW